jgi:membrane fusion protein (multidrug efflux system)
MTAITLPKESQVETDLTDTEYPTGSRRRFPRIVRYGLTILALILLLGTLGGLKASQIAMMIHWGEEAEKNGPPPETVSTARAESQTWEETLRSVGSIVSAKGVVISNDTPGVVSKLHFESGAHVRGGQVLVELDARVEQAQLRSIRARRNLAETSMNRSQSLHKEGAVSQSQVEMDSASFESLSAEEQALQAQIEHKTIRAPFSGKLGLRQVNLGQYLPAGTMLTELESIQSAFVDFSLPQHDLETLKVGMPVRVSEEAAESPVVLEGTISAVDSGVNAVTRTVKVRASLPRSDRLRPGMFVRVAVILPQKADVVAIPSTSVIHAAYGDSVFSVELKPAAPDGKPHKVARQRFVKLGGSRGDFTAVASGLTAGEEVVVSGAFKLRNDVPLIIDNKSVAFAPELSPHPENR